MQEKSEKFSEFSERTEALAEHIHVNLSDLPEKLGFSASMMHAYRSGKYPISLKAWRKLEAAERAAGVASAAPPPDAGAAAAIASSSANPNNPPPFSQEEFQLRSIVREEIAVYHAKPQPTLEKLMAAMSAENAWPPSPEDSLLSLSILCLKYLPP